MAGLSQCQCEETGAANKPRPKPSKELPAIYASDELPAPIVGIQLFDLEPTMLSTFIASNKAILTLLPKSAR